MTNPQLLVVARESRGLTQSELASATELTQAAISKYESGQLELSSVVAAKLAGALGYPPEFLSIPERLYGFGSACVFHRKRKSVGIKLARRLQALTNIYRIRATRLVASDPSPIEVNIPTYDLEENGGSPERIAEFVRVAWKLPFGPIGNLVETIENAGGIVLVLPFGSRQLDAVSQWAPGAPPIFILNEEMPPDRRRLSLAHELGHLVMHATPTETQETEADRFAGAFLMPEDDIREDLEDINLERLAQLKIYWRVSMAALLMRAQRLETIPAHTAKRLWMWMSARGYRTEEPVTIQPERPTRLDGLLQLHRTKLGYSEEALRSLLYAGSTEELRALSSAGGELRLLS